MTVRCVTVEFGQCIAKHCIVRVRYFTVTFWQSLVLFGVVRALCGASE